MSEWIKTLLTSGVVAGMVSVLTTSCTIEKTLHTDQGKEGYEALIEANRLLRSAKELDERARRPIEAGMSEEARKLQRASDDQYVIAQHKIAAFGDERVVEALSAYYVRFLGADKRCEDRDKYRADTEIYRAVRDTLGVGGSVSSNELATILFHCSLK